MAWEVTFSAVVAVAGVIGLRLWVDHRVALDGAEAVTLAALIATTTVAVAAALRVTALQSPLGAVTGVAIALTGWAILAILTTHPPATLESGHAGVRPRRPLQR